jgi:large-conductance mechanosensitive channel
MANDDFYMDHYVRSPFMAHVIIKNIIYALCLIYSLISLSNHVAGLLMLSGLIMFISIFKSEVFHKLRPTRLEPAFTFSYGHSFILYVIGFIVVELAGILNVCFFNKLQKAEELNQVTVSGAYR